MTTQARALTILSLGAALLTASAQTTPTTSQATADAKVPPSLSETEQMIKDIKNPVSWLTWGADLRIRNEYFNDLITLNPNVNLHEQDYFRYRGRLWTSITPLEDVSLNARLAAEPRTWLEPAGYTPFKGHSGTDMREGIVDNLNSEWKNIGGLPLSAKVGRQDLFLGDGWLVADGTPQDGSWTYYLDSAKLTYNLKDQQTTIEAIGIIQDAYDNAWLPTINPQNLAETDQNEKGAIIQISNSSIQGLTLTPFFMYKEDSKVLSTGDNADIYTIGGRASGALSEHWAYMAEGAYQCGRKADTNIKYPVSTARSSAYRTLSAYGCNTKLSYLFKDQLNNQLSFSFELLSGDNPSTDSDEMFDVLWGRWPRWSEIGLYSYAEETRIGQQANLIRLGPTWTINPIKNMEFSASYYALWAPESIPTRELRPPQIPTPVFSNDGNYRGNFFSTVLKYKFSEHMNGHLWGEFLFPSSYYVNQVMIPFVRAEVMFTF